MFRKKDVFDRAAVVRLACDYAELDYVGFPLADPLEDLLVRLRRFGGDLRGPLMDLMLNPPSLEELEASAPHLFEEGYEPDCRSDGGRSRWGLGLHGVLEAVLVTDPGLAFSLASLGEEGLSQVTSALYSLQSNPNDSSFVRAAVATYGRLVKKEVRRIERLSDKAALCAVTHLHAVEGEASLPFLREALRRVKPVMERTRLRIEELLGVRLNG